METSHYVELLKNVETKLLSVKFDEGKSLMLTLGSSENIVYDCFQDAVKKFIASFKYQYGKIQYIRGIECYEKGIDRYHCHLIILFPNSIPKMNEQWLKKHWTYGKVNIRHQREFEYNDPVRYITKFKENNIDPDNRSYTKFPQFVSPIRTSRNLPKSNIIYNGVHDKFISIRLHDELIEQKQVKVNTHVHYYGNDKKCFDSECFYNTQNGNEILNKILEDDNTCFDPGENIF